MVTTEPEGDRKVVITLRFWPFTMMATLCCLTVVGGAIGAWIYYKGYNIWPSRREGETATQLEVIQGALEKHKLANGRYPDYLDELVQPKEDQHYGAAISLRDGWGNGWMYRASQDGLDYALASRGRDGIPGNRDDIQPWYIPDHDWDHSKELK